MASAPRRKETRQRILPGKTFDSEPPPRLPPLSSQRGRIARVDERNLGQHSSPVCTDHGPFWPRGYPAGGLESATKRRQSRRIADAVRAIQLKRREIVRSASSERPPTTAPFAFTPLESPTPAPSAVPSPCDSCAPFDSCDLFGLFDSFDLFDPFDSCDLFDSFDSFDLCAASPARRPRSVPPPTNPHRYEAGRTPP